MSAPPYFPRAPATSRRTPAASPRLTLVQRPAAPPHVRRLRPPLRGRPRRARRFDARVQEGHRCRAPARAPRATRLRGDPHRARRRDHPEGHQGRAREGHAGTCAKLRRPRSPATSLSLSRAIYPKPRFFRGAKKRCSFDSRARKRRASYDAPRLTFDDPKKKPNRRSPNRSSNCSIRTGRRLW